MYYDDEEDDDPYAPRTGPAAMPSPRSKYAPYYSGCTDTLEDFLEEYEGLAYSRALTDPQRVDVIIRYVAPSLRDFWRSLNGYRSRDWHLFRQSLINVFGNTTPRHQIMRQKLHSCVQDSSRSRMLCEDNVLRYYRKFICFGIPLVHTGHLSEEERDAAFWYGFHPEDRKVIQPRLIGKNPFQPSDVPFHFEDVLSCARAAFAYHDYFPSPWSHAKQFEPPSLRREQPVVEPAPRDAYSFQAVTCAIASNAETTTIPDELPPSSQSHVIQPPSSSPSASESHQTQAPSVTVDQPEPAHTFSTTLFPSASPSHTSSPVHPATDNDLIPAPTFPITTSTLLPSAFPIPIHVSSLVHSAADGKPEILSTFPSPPITPAPFSMLMSDFEYLPSATVDQPEPTLSSTPPSSSSIPPTFLLSPARLATEDQPEPESASTPSIIPSSPALLSAPSLASPSTDDVPEIASTPRCSSEVPPTNFECLPSAMVDNPEFEPVRAPMSSMTSTSPFVPHTPSLAPSFTDDIPELFPTLPALQSASLARSEVPTSLSSPTKPSPSETPTSAPARSLLPLRPSLGESCCNLGLEPFAAPANLAPSHLTFVLPPVLPASSDLPSASPSSSFVLSPDLESSTVNIAPRSSLESSWSSVSESVLLPTPLDVLQNASIPPHPLPLQRSLGVTSIGSSSFLLEVTPPLASSVPQQSQELSLVHEVPSTLAPRFPLTLPPLTPSRSGLAYFNFAFALISTALVSTLLNISKTLSTFTRKSQSKIEDLGSSQNGNLKTSKSLARNIPAHRLRLGQLTPRAPRLVFDPGGQSSSFKLLSAHESVTRRHAAASP